MDGSVVQVESGFEFFSDALYPTFVQLLKVLGLELRHYPLTATIYTTDHRQNTLLPPYREGKIIWSGFRPTPLSHLIRFQRTLRIAERVASTPDTSLTVEQFFDCLPFAQAFKDEFLWPFFLTQWCVEPDEFKTFSAYNTVRYATRMRVSSLTPPRAIAIAGGTQAYINKLHCPQREPRSRPRWPSGRLLVPTQCMSWKKPMVVAANLTTSSLPRDPTMHTGFSAGCPKLEKDAERLIASNTSRPP